MASEILPGSAQLVPSSLDDTPSLLPLSKRIIAPPTQTPIIQTPMQTPALTALQSPFTPTEQHFPRPSLDLVQDSSIRLQNALGIHIESPPPQYYQAPSSRFASQHCVNNLLRLAERRQSKCLEREIKRREDGVLHAEEREEPHSEFSEEECQDEGEFDGECPIELDFCEEEESLEDDEFDEYVDVDVLSVSKGVPYNKEDIGFGVEEMFFDVLSVTLGKTFGEFGDFLRGFLVEWYVRALECERGR